MYTIEWKSFCCGCKFFIIHSSLSGLSVEKQRDQCDGYSLPKNLPKLYSIVERPEPKDVFPLLIGATSCRTQGIQTHAYQFWRYALLLNGQLAL